MGGEAASARAPASRRLMPAFIRSLPLLPLGEALGTDLRWKPLGHPFGIGFTRDVCMHRIDVSRAGREPLTPTAERDGRIVADIVAQ